MVFGDLVLYINDGNINIYINLLESEVDEINK